MFSTRMKRDCFVNACLTRLPYLRMKSCRVGKQSKSRLIVLLAADEDRSENFILPLLDARVNLDTSLKIFTFKYKANRKAWVTSGIFGDWLKSLDKSMLVKKRKIIPFIDNCSTHNNLLALKNVSINFFSRITTSEWQPMDPGKIRRFKVNSRRQADVDAIDSTSLVISK